MEYCAYNFAKKEIEAHFSVIVPFHAESWFSLADIFPSPGLHFSVALAGIAGFRLKRLAHALVAKVWITVCAGTENFRRKMRNFRWRGMVLQAVPRARRPGTCGGLRL